MTKIVECVPNFSEGTDPTLVDDIVSAVKTARVLNVHSDPDHNRTVVTIIGDPKGVSQAAFDLAERAVQLLDVVDNFGVHPFIGVMDVIPFVPIKGVSLQETCRIAESLGRELWRKLQLPVYFYGETAKSAVRRDLPDVRRGGYKALKLEVYDVAARKPDIGYGLHVTGGATSIGVRDFLIAFNVNLKTNEIDLAKSIAKNIREKSGGLPGVRALGLALSSQGITQVSINLTDHKMTSLKQIFDAVTKWANEYQVEILCSELVGLLPQEAVFPDMQKYLKLPVFSDKFILEKYL